MAGLLQFPTVERTPPGGEPSGLFALPDDLLEPGELLGEVRHAITHHRIRARVRAGRAGYRGAREGLGWLRRSALVDAELTGMARKVLRAGFLER